MTLTSKRGERTLDFPSFYKGVRRTAMEPDEMLTAITFPALARNERGMFLKLGLRKAQAISVVNAAVILGFDGRSDYPCARSRWAASRRRSCAFRWSSSILQGETLTDEVIREAARLAASAPTPIDDVRSSAAYRTEMCRVLVARALRALRDGTERDEWPADPAMLWGPQQAMVHEALPSSVRHEDDASDTIVTTVNGTDLYGDRRSEQNAAALPARRCWAARHERRAAPKANAARVRSFWTAWR